jgi:hypothetical protein
MSSFGHAEKLHGFERLDRLTRSVENQIEPLADFDVALAPEWSISDSIGGRTVFDDRNERTNRTAVTQGSLF